MPRRRPSTTFTPVFDHTAITLAFCASVILATNTDTTVPGLLITLALAAASAHYAFRTRTELFLLYAVLYSAIAIDAWVWNTFTGTALRSFVLLATSVVCVVSLVLAHRKFRR